MPCAGLARERVQRSTGLWELLIAEWERQMARWRIPGRVSEYEVGLKSRAAVEVSSATLMCAKYRLTHIRGRVLTPRESREVSENSS